MRTKLGICGENCQVRQAATTRNLFVLKSNRPTNCRLLVVVFLLIALPGGWDRLEPQATDLRNESAIVDFDCL